jgi:hypothetical protein
LCDCVDPLKTWKYCFNLLLLLQTLPLHIIIAPLRTSQCLCVVVLLHQQYLLEDGYCPPAIKPATCAISTAKYAPTLIS